MHNQNALWGYGVGGKMRHMRVSERGLRNDAQVLYSKCAFFLKGLFNIKESFYIMLIRHVNPSESATGKYHPEFY